MDWRNATLNDMERLFRALQAAKPDDREVIERIIERVESDHNLPYARVTIGSLLKLLEQTGGSTSLPDEIVRQLCQPEPVGTESINHIAAGVYPITVNYNQPLAIRIAAGHYDYADGDITPENFLVNVFGQVGMDTILTHYSEGMSSEAVLADLDRRGLRPATIAELLAFGATYPDKQRKIAIVALGSISSDTDYRQKVAMLCGGDSVRNLFLLLFDTRWDANTGFLATGK